MSVFSSILNGRFRDVDPVVKLIAIISLGKDANGYTKMRFDICRIQKSCQTPYCTVHGSPTPCSQLDDDQSDENHSPVRSSTIEI